MDRPQNKQISLEQLTTTLVWIYQVVGVVILLATVFLVGGFVQTPFTGALYDANLLVEGSTPQGELPGWSLASQGVGFGYQVLAVNGQPVRTPGELQAALRQYFPGETIPILMRTPQGSEQVFQVTLSKFPITDQITFFVLPYIIGVSFLAAGLWVFYLRRNEAAGMAFAIFAASAGVASGAFPDLLTTNAFAPIWVMYFVLMGGALIHLALVFPQEAHLVRKYPYLTGLGYLISAGFVLSIWITAALTSDPLVEAAAWRNGFVWVGISGFIFLTAVLYRRFSAESPIVRRQTNTILIATLSLLPTLILFILSAQGQQPFYLITIAPVIIFPIMTGYTVTRYRMLRTDYVISRSVLYALLSLLAIGGYILLSIGLNLVFSQVFPVDSPALIAVLVFYSTLLLMPVRQRLQEWIDTVFFRGQRAYQRRLQAFARAVTTLNTVNDITAALRENILSALAPSRLHIYIYDPVNDQYTATADESGRHTSDIRFAGNSALPRLLSREDEPLFIDETQISSDLESERT
ncbi:MAG: hypothetical protein WHV44_15935, partial [Anaerolineales bacterium]